MKNLSKRRNTFLFQSRKKSINIAYAKLSNIVCDDLKEKGLLHFMLNFDSFVKRKQKQTNPHCKKRACILHTNFKDSVSYYTMMCTILCNILGNFWAKHPLKNIIKAS